MQAHCAVVMLTLPMHECAFQLECEYEQTPSHDVMSVAWMLTHVAASAQHGYWPSTLHSMHMHASFAYKMSIVLSVALCTTSDHQQYDQSTRHSCSPTTFHESCQVQAPGKALQFA